MGCRQSTENQVNLALRRLADFPPSRRVFLFINVSAIHQPNRFYLPGAAEDCLESHAAALAYVDEHLGRLLAGLRQRGPWLAVVCSDHGTAYGEDGYHRPSPCSPRRLGSSLRRVRPLGGQRMIRLAEASSDPARQPVPGLRLRLPAQDGLPPAGAATAAAGRLGRRAANRRRCPRARCRWDIGKSEDLGGRGARLLPSLPPPSTEHLAIAAVNHYSRSQAMRTFQYSDAKSHKFWNIEVSGDSFTVTYGKVGSAGQTQTKTFATAAKAQAEADKLIQEKLKKGYGETTPRAAAAPTESFERALIANPNDSAAWGIYGDYLVEQGDPRGEFMQIQIALEDESLPKAKRTALKKQEASLLEKHEHDWLGGAGRRCH